MATPFYIQWREMTGGGSGTFVGRNLSTATWQSLDAFTLSKYGNYQFYLSVNSAVTSDRFISLTEQGSHKIGVKLGPGNGDANPVSIGPITLGDRHLTFIASLLGATDPKFPVAWGKGGTQAKVVANWSGEIWTIQINGTLQSGIDSFPVDTSNSIEFVIKDSSRKKQWAALIVMPSADAIQSTILHETDLSTKGNYTDTYTVTQTTGETNTLFGLNLYDVMATTGILYVS